MNNTKNGQPDDAGLPPPEALLPWYATGRLSVEDETQVERALAADGELRRRLALVRDEEADTISVNEGLGMPSGSAMDRLMLRIDAYEAEHPRRVPISERALGWISGFLSGLSPRTLAWSATAAAVVICLQAGLLTGLIADRHQAAHYGTASLEPKAESKGTYALVSFVGTVSMKDATAFLLDHHVSRLEPNSTGMYRIKIADEKLTGEALNAKLAELRKQTNVVALILPDGTP